MPTGGKELRISFFDLFWLYLDHVECETTCDGSVFGEASGMTASNSTSVIALSNIFSMSLQSCGPFGTCEIPFQMLSSASLGIVAVLLSLLS